MSGCFADYNVKAKTWADLQDEFQRISDQCRYENGHIYSGGIGMKDGVVDMTRHAMPVGSAPYADPDVAFHHCEQENDKWGPAWAYRTGPDTWFFGGWCSS